MTRPLIIEATEKALRAVDASRYFVTERGFHGRFYCTLQHELELRGMFSNEAILEIEYQKSKRHSMHQRPDIVLHVPAEHSGAAVIENNFAVWALKRCASPKEAIDDFALLDEMLERLNYPLGIFVNIAADDPMLQHYNGANRDRLAAVAVRQVGDAVETRWA